MNVPLTQVAEQHFELTDIHLVVAVSVVLVVVASQKFLDRLGSGRVFVTCLIIGSCGHGRRRVEIF